MRKIIFISFFCILIGTSSYSNVRFEQISLLQAIEKAKQTNKYILIDFYTDWCIPCKELDKHIFQDSTISQFINNKYIALKVNGESDLGLKLMQKYHITESYPTLLFLDSDGIEIDRIIGLFNNEEYFQKIQDYSQNKNTLSTLLSQVKKGNDNPTLNLALGKKYSERGLWESAHHYYNKALSQHQSINDAGTWWNIGWVYFKVEEYLKAQNAVKKAIEIEPDNPFLKKFLQKIQEKLQ